ncbi:MAG: DUF421 domain-containing protein [Pseudomonadota bacterium]
MWSISLSHWSEFLIRTTVVYVFLLFALRITGKKQVGQMAPFDLVTLLVLSNAVQNSMVGGDNSLVGGLISASGLVAINWITSWLTFRSKNIERLLEGRPTILVHNGKIDPKAMRSSQITIHELNAELRNHGCASLEQVRFAILENNGQVSVIPRTLNVPAT